MLLKDVLIRMKQESGLTTLMLSERSGVPKGTLNKLLNGETKNPTRETLQRLASALSCPIDLLCRPDSAQGYPFVRRLSNANDILSVSRNRVPLLGEIAAGVPIYADEAFEYTSCDESLSCDFALRVRGDSMTGARICDGDIVFIRSQDDVEDGEIAAVMLGDEATLKRVYHIKNGLQLLPMNPKYAPMLFTLDECDSIRILGKAVGFQSSL